MTTTAAVANRERELAEQHQAFVRATVVRAQKPTSAHAGDVALVDALGVMTGFVGGQCVEASVREFGLRVLETGEPVLLKVRPGEVGRDEQDGVVEVHNPCLSGGSVDLFLEPVLPAAHLVVVGDTPVAQALARLGAELGFEAELVDGESWQPDEHDLALVVASHGKGEEPALARALEAGIPYVGLVASRVRGAAVVASLDIDDALRERVHSPAGMWLGGSAPAEIALGVLAEIVQLRASGELVGGHAAAHDAMPAGHGDHGDHEAGHDAMPHGLAAGAPAPGGVATAIDPVCGMTVVAADPTPRAEVDGVVIWFCGEGCRTRYLEDPGRYEAA